MAEEVADRHNNRPILGEIVRLDFGDEDHRDHSVMHITYDKNIRVGARGEVAVVTKEYLDELTKKASLAD